MATPPFLLSVSFLFVSAGCASPRRVERLVDRLKGFLPTLGSAMRAAVAPSGRSIPDRSDAPASPVPLQAVSRIAFAPLLCHSAARHYSKYPVSGQSDPAAGVEFA